jgi:hypothetical protein
MLIDAFFFICLLLLAFPLVGGHFAESRGRSFWAWFLVCTFLPVIGYFILICLPNLANPLEKDLEKIRIKNKLLGINPAADEITSISKVTKEVE